MKTIILSLIFLLIALFTFSQAQIPNGDLESWTDENNAEGWNSLNFPYPEIHSAVQTDDAYEGDYAAELSGTSTFLGYIPGMITLGTPDPENLTVTGGIEFSDKPNGISFQFKYSPVDSDTMFLAAVLTKWNEVTEETDTIGVTGYFTGETFNTYTYIAVPFIYLSEETPDTLNVIFLSSGFSGNDGSSLIIDNIRMEYGAVISPTICFPAEDISSSSFTANWLSIPNAVSYNVDVSEEADFSSFYNNLEDVNTGINTYYTVDISPGLYFYRARVFYDPEVSMNSNVITVPSPTNCLDANNITESSFDANWEVANNATNYFIDVSETENFETFVDGYENLSAGNQNNATISGLNAGTEYFYRVRVEYGEYLSIHSEPISVNTETVSINKVSPEFTVRTDHNTITIITENFKDAEISLYDLNGKLTKQRHFNKSVCINTAKQGIYILKIRYSGKTYVRKIALIN